MMSLNFTFTINRFVGEPTLLIKLFTFVSSKHFTCRAMEDFTFVLKFMFDNSFKNFLNSLNIKSKCFFRYIFRLTDMCLSCIMKEIIRFYLLYSSVNAFKITQVPIQDMNILVILLKFFNLLFVRRSPSYKCIDFYVLILKQIPNQMETKLTSGSRDHNFFHK